MADSLIILIKDFKGGKSMNIEIIKIIKKVRKMLYEAFKSADGLHIPSEGDNLALPFSAPIVIKLSKEANKKNRKRR